MEKNPLGLAKFIILQPTLEQGGYSVSPEFEDLSLPTTLVEFSLPVLFQCHRQNCLSLLLVHDVQNFLFALLSYFRLLSTFNSGSLFKLWGIQASVSVSWLLLSPEGVLESFQGHGCLLAGWQLVNYCDQTKLPGARRYPAKRHICTDTNWVSTVSVASATCWAA